MTTFWMEGRCSILRILTGELEGFGQDENGLVTYILTWMAVAVKPELNLKFVLGYTVASSTITFIPNFGGLLPSWKWSAVWRYAQRAIPWRYMIPVKNI